MEAWRDELYHGLLDNIRARVNTAVKNTASSAKRMVSPGTAGKGRQWKEHKYVRIENGRYIYPEDLKKKANSVGNKVTKRK